MDSYNLKHHIHKQVCIAGYRDVASGDVCVAGGGCYTLPTEMTWKNQVKSWNSQVKYQVKKYAKVSALSNQETHYQCLMETKEIRFSMDSADCLRAILFYVIIFPI